MTMMSWGSDSAEAMAESLLPKGSHGGKVAPDRTLWEDGEEQRQVTSERRTQPLTFTLDRVQQLGGGKGIEKKWIRRGESSLLILQRVGGSHGVLISGCALQAMKYSAAASCRM